MAFAPAAAQAHGFGFLSFQTVSLDTHAAPNTGAAQAYTSQPLQSGHIYAVLVRGTWSAYRANLWTGSVFPFGACGSPEPAPIYPSTPPPNNQGMVGQDAETAFGLVFPQPCPSTVHLPFHTTNFQMDLGSGFSHLEPVLGPHSSPNTWHTYLYIVKGQGKPLGFEQIDSNTADNYGQYKMLVIGFTTSRCSGIGWMMFNGMFSSSRDCSHYASPNGTSASQMSTPDYDAPTDFDSLSGTGGV